MSDMPITSYDVIQNKVDISSVLSLVAVNQTPFLDLIGIGKPVLDTTYGWYDDRLPKRESVLAADYTSGTSTTLTVATGDGAYFPVGSVVKVGSTVYKVTAVNGDVLTVTALNADANHTTGDAFIFISIPRAEGKEYEAGTYFPATSRENLTQIFSDYVSISGTQQKIAQYVNTPVFTSEVSKKLAGLKIQLEMAIVNSIYHKPATNADVRMMKGILQFLGDNGVTGTGTLTEANFKAFLRDIWANGGSPTVAIMDSTSAEFFNSLQSDNVIVQRNDQTAGRLVTGYLTQYGEVRIKVDRWFPANTIVVLSDTNRVKVHPLSGRAFFYEQLAKTGDGVKGQIVGEYTLEVRNPETHGVYTVA